jgi:hypothetical protein
VRSEKQVVRGFVVELVRDAVAADGPVAPRLERAGTGENPCAGGEGDGCERGEQIEAVTSFHDVTSEVRSIIRL